MARTSLLLKKKKKKENQIRVRGGTQEEEPKNKSPKTMDMDGSWAHGQDGKQLICSYMKTTSPLFPNKMGLSSSMTACQKRDSCGGPHPLDVSSSTTAFRRPHLITLFQRLRTSHVWPLSVPFITIVPK